MLFGCIFYCCLQNTSESDNDEVDGNNICGFRKKKGVKGPAKYVAPLENAKMELSCTSEIPDPRPLQGITGCSEPPSEQSLQNPASFPSAQKDRGGCDSSHTGSNIKEDTSGEAQEIQEDADTGTGIIGKMHKEIDTPAKTEQLGGIQPARSTGKAGSAEEAFRGEGSEKVESKQEEPCVMEEKDVRFHVMKMGSLNSTVTTQGSSTAQSFAGAPDISKRSLKELKNLLSEGPLPARGPGYSGKASVSFSQKNSKPWEKTADKRGRPFETFSPHFGEENRKQHIFHEEGMGQQSKPLLIFSSAGSDQQQPAGSDGGHLLGPPAASTHAESTAAEIQFDSSARYAGKIFKHHLLSCQRKCSCCFVDFVKLQTLVRASA